MGGAGASPANEVFLLAAHDWTWAAFAELSKVRKKKAAGHGAGLDYGFTRLTHFTKNRTRGAEN